MIQFLDRLYFGDRAEKQAIKLRKMIKEGKPYPELYLVTFASNGKDQLDILNSLFLSQKRIRDSLPVVAGIAIGKEEAFEVVRKIVEDAWHETGKADLQRYLLSQQDKEH